MFTIRSGAVVTQFASLRELLAKASARKSGDELAGVAAQTDEERALARLCLSEVPLRAFLDEPLVPYEEDEISRLLLDSHDAHAFAPVSSMNVGELRDYLLGDEASPECLARLAPGLTPEMVAAVSKLMRDQDLLVVAKKCRVVTRFRTTLGEAGTLAARLQPNHPTDAPEAILAGAIDGLAYGMGDAVLGVNPARDSVTSLDRITRLLDELRQKLEVPLQTCVLGHVTTQLAALERGSPIDLVFQSIAGSEKANRAFGVDLALLDEAKNAVDSLARGGPNRLYFETGQGSALSSEAAFGVDQQTMETRAYGVARRYAPLLVNTVVGFIGPEYLYDGRQILRAGLEDHFAGKLLGLPMGVDVCYTNHAEADQNDMDDLMFLLTSAGVNFLITVPGADDIMLGYQSLSFHDVATLRAHFGLRPAPEFAVWLERIGLFREGKLLPRSGATDALLLGGLR